MEFTIQNLHTGSRQVLSINKTEVIIGSSPVCDIKLIGEGISGRHVRFYRQGHHRFLDVCEGAMVELFRGEPDQHQELKPGEYCRIDGQPFKVAQFIVQSI